MEHGAWGMGARSMALFRFQDLVIWKEAVAIAHELFDIADELEKRKLFRFAEQLRGAGLSISNNIAEGSGSIHNKEFVNFLNVARRSIFENANIVIVFNQRKMISDKTATSLLDRLHILSKKITKFQQTLK